MENSPEQDVAYKEEDLEIKTPVELEEAKREAGVTTPEEAQERIKKITETMIERRSDVDFAKRLISHLKVKEGDIIEVRLKDGSIKKGRYGGFTYSYDVHLLIPIPKGGDRVRGQGVSVSDIDWIFKVDEKEGE